MAVITKEKRAELQKVIHSYGVRHMVETTTYKQLYDSVEDEFFIQLRNRYKDAHDKLCLARTALNTFDNEVYRKLRKDESDALLAFHKAETELENYIG